MTLKAAHKLVSNPSTDGETLSSSEPAIQANPSFPEDLARRLHAPIWKAFSFDSGNFLLHVPSSHIVEASPEAAAHVRGDHIDADIETALGDLAASLPLPSAQNTAPDIQAISLNMAQGCNLRCTYCFAGDGDYGNKGLMSFEVAKAVITQFSQGRERFSLIFFGGEPLLNYPVIKQVVEWCKTLKCRFNYAMTTNGTLLTAEKLAFLQENKFKLTISYDGKGLQSKQRFTMDQKTSSEPLIERKLKAFKEQLGLLRDIVLRTTVSRPNLQDLEESIVSTLNSKDFKLAVWRHATSDKSLAFSHDDVKALADTLGRVIERLLAKEDYERLLQLLPVKMHLKTIHRGETGLKACGAGLTYLTVSSQGRFYLCHRFNEDESENFGDLERGLDHQKLADVAQFRSKGAPECSTCWLRQWCSGGCMHENKAASGNKFQLDATYCQLLSAELEQVMRVYSVLREKAPNLLESL